MSSAQPAHLPPTPALPTSALTVFCGSALGTSPAFVGATNQLGAALGRHGITCVYGGGGSGLMGTVKNVSTVRDEGAAGGHCTGLTLDRRPARTTCRLRSALGECRLPACRAIADARRPMC